MKYQVFITYQYFTLNVTCSFQYFLEQKLSTFCLTYWYIYICKASVLRRPIINPAIYLPDTCSYIFLNGEKICIVGDSWTFVFPKWECYPLYYKGLFNYIEFPGIVLKNCNSFFYNPTPTTTTITPLSTQHPARKIITVDSFKIERANFRGLWVFSLLVGM